MDMPYINDLEVWKHSILPWIRNDIEAYQGKGLYTGETILHMAIVFGDAKFVRYLLKNDADVHAKVDGQFFMPTVWRRGQKKKRQLSWREEIVEKILTRLRIRDIDDRYGDLNSESAFEVPDLYFGQTTMALAASAGHVHVCCELRKYFVKKRLNADEEVKGTAKDAVTACKKSVGGFGEVVMEDVGAESRGHVTGSGGRARDTAHEASNANHVHDNQEHNSGNNNHNNHNNNKNNNNNNNNNHNNSNNINNNNDNNNNNRSKITPHRGSGRSGSAFLQLDASDGYVNGPRTGPNGHHNAGGEVPGGSASVAAVAGGSNVGCLTQSTIAAAGGGSGGGLSVASVSVGAHLGTVVNSTGTVAGRGGVASVSGGLSHSSGVKSSSTYYKSWSFRSMPALQKGHSEKSILIHDDNWSDFVNNVDDFGNTALHISVMHNQKAMVDWLMENGAKKSLRIMNHQGLTPLTLSVWLGNVDMYKHIANNYLSEVLWTFGSCRLQFVDLEQIDSFRMEKPEPEANKFGSKKHSSVTERTRSRLASRRSDASSEQVHLHGDPLWRSAFEIIIEKELPDFTVDPIFDYLIKTKWSRFGCWIYLVLVVGVYVLLLALYVTGTLLRIDDLDRESPYLPEHQGKQPEEYIIHNFEAFQDASGEIFLFLASVGSLLLLYMAWILMRARVRDLQNHDGRFSIERFRMYAFKNMTSLCFAVMIGLLEGIVAARHYGNHGLVSICFSTHTKIHTCIYSYIHKHRPPPFFFPFFVPCCAFLTVMSCALLHIATARICDDYGILVHICMYTYIDTYMHACMHTYIRTYIHTYIHAYMHACIYTCIHTYMHAYVCAYVRTYVHTYIHTYIHTYTQIMHEYRSCMNFYICA
jgi:hypothetical protein